MSGSLIPPILNPSSLYKEEAKRDATRIRTYNMILIQIYNKIKAAARIPGGDKAIFYTIPEIIPGTPRFDMGDAVLYIVWNLRNVGYFVDYVWPNGLYVNWRAHDEMYRRVESPWSKVMQSARELVLKGDATPTTISHATPGPSIATPAEVIKRKSVLKKTVEFSPPGETTPSAANPAVLQSMYASARAPTANRLPGQLSERHVSFV